MSARTDIKNISPSDLFWCKKGPDFDHRQFKTIVVRWREGGASGDHNVPFVMQTLISWLISDFTLPSSCLIVCNWMITCFFSSIQDTTGLDFTRFLPDFHPIFTRFLSAILFFKLNFTWINPISSKRNEGRNTKSLKISCEKNFSDHLVGVEITTNSIRHNLGKILRKGVSCWIFSYQDAWQVVLFDLRKFPRRSFLF